VTPSKKGESPLAVKCLLKNRIDHSGVFPPTALSFDAAIKKASGFPVSLKNPSMIGSEMVIPFEDLPKIDTNLIEKYKFTQENFRISIINGTPVEAKRIEILQQNIKSCINFNKTGLSAKIISFESKYQTSHGNELNDSLILLQREAALGNSQEILYFIEPDLSHENWKHTLDSTCLVLKNLNKNLTLNLFGFKARTSGPQGLSQDNLALVIEYITKSKLPFKVTGGLHHPLSGKENLHGFLSLSIAVCFARKFDLPAGDILEILSLASIESLSIDESIAWKGKKISAKEIENAMNTPHFSIGCCNPNIQDQELSELLG